MVKEVAQTNSQGMEDAECYNEAYLAFCNAIGNYKKNRSVKFSNVFWNYLKKRFISLSSGIVKEDDGNGNGQRPQNDSETDNMSNVPDPAFAQQSCRRIFDFTRVLRRCNDSERELLSVIGLSITGYPQCGRRRSFLGKMQRFVAGRTLVGYGLYCVEMDNGDMLYIIAASYNDAGKIARRYGKVEAVKKWRDF